MLILLEVVFLVLIFLGWIFKDDDEHIGFWAAGFLSVIPCLITTLALIIMLFIYPYGVDQKIAMYEEENIKIEEKVRNSVKGYMDFENDTLKNLIDTSDLQTLLIKYPDLNSNELVKMEIETYKENSQKIKELKEKSVTRHYKAWWLYFGK